MSHEVAPVEIMINSEKGHLNSSDKHHQRYCIYKRGAKEIQVKSGTLDEKAMVWCDRRRALIPIGKLNKKSRPADTLPPYVDEKDYFRSVNHWKKTFTCMFNKYTSCEKTDLRNECLKLVQCEKCCGMTCKPDFHMYVMTCMFPPEDNRNQNSRLHPENIDYPDRKEYIRYSLPITCPECSHEYPKLDLERVLDKATYHLYGTMLKKSLFCTPGRNIPDEVLSHVQSCPNRKCRASLTKDASECTHVTCLSCQMKWCWVCRRELVTDPELYHARMAEGDPRVARFNLKSPYVTTNHPKGYSLALHNTTDSDDPSEELEMFLKGETDIQPTYCPLYCRNFAEYKLIKRTNRKRKREA